MPIAVAGMHRSGTSMITRLLHLCGLDLGDPASLIPATPDNPEGYWEHRDFVDLNDDLLETLGGGWDCPPEFPFLWSDLSSFAEEAERGRHLAEKFDATEPWGWKDPRNSLTMPFWQSLLPDLRVVVCVRHPRQVADSLRRRGMFSSTLSLHLWRTYNQQVLTEVPPERRIVTHYDRFFQEPAAELRRLVSFCGMTGADLDVTGVVHSVRPELRHSAPTDTGGDRLPEELFHLYSVLCREAGVAVDASPGGSTSWAADLPRVRRSLDLAGAGDRRRPSEPEQNPLRDRDALLEVLRRLERRQEALERTVRDLRDEHRRTTVGLEMSLFALEYADGTSTDQLSAAQVRYREEVRRVRATVHGAVPSDAHVVVVSKGDADLLRLFGRRASHFPGDVSGGYSGYHLHDSDAVLVHLAYQRARGAEYLVLPASYLWWLDEYPALRTHLEERCTELVRQDDVCRIYALREPSSGTSPALLVERAVREFVGRSGFSPAVLNWTAIADLAPKSGSVFFPVRADEARLPHLDSSIDLVLIDEAEKEPEARRVSRGAVVRVDRREPGIRWVSDQAAAPPTVSVIVAAYDGIQHTAACLTSLRATVPASHDVEMIVVDDASSDGTWHYLSGLAEDWSRLRPLRNETNSGYLPSVTRGAAAATGEVLIFLNNDTVLLEDWLPPILRVLEQHPDAGAVGARLLYPDGRLQEAGGMVFRDASATKVGYGDERPDRPPYTHLRPVDYCSGALLATPRKVFESLDGFDPRYGFGYYEDTDYCFAVRASGRTVYYQPESRVVHVEGGTAGRDLDVGAKRNQAMNQAVFAEKWRDQLAGAPERPDPLTREAVDALVLRGTTVAGA